MTPKDSRNSKINWTGSVSSVSKNVAQSVNPTPFETMHSTEQPISGLRRIKAALVLSAIFGTPIAGYSFLGSKFDWIPFPGTPQGDIPTLTLPETQKANDAETKFAKDIAGSDGIFDKNERNEVCKIAESQGTDQLNKTNEIIEIIRNKRIAGVRLSSANLKGCTSQIGK